MSFVDELHLKVFSGKGGQGCLSFASSRRQARGGPDGGDGGRGGSVIIQVDPNKFSLDHLKKKMCYRAGTGQPGRSRKQKGHKGKDVILNVPPYTWMTLDGKSVQLKNTYVLLTGGQGGKGNYFFKTSVNQSPRKVGLGKEGCSQNIYLETRLQAKISILGWHPLGPCSFLKDLLKLDNIPSSFLFARKAPCVRHNPSGFCMIEIPSIKHFPKFLKHTLSSQILIPILFFKNAQQCMEHYQQLLNTMQNFSLSLLQKKIGWYLLSEDGVSNNELKKTKELFREKNLDVFSEIKSLEGFIENHIQ